MPPSYPFPHAPGEPATLTITTLKGVPTPVFYNTDFVGTVIYQVFFVEMKRLDEIGDVHWHLLDLSAIKLFDFSHHAHILSGNEVDRNTLSSETTSTTNSVDVVLTIGGKIVVDDQGDLLDINTTSQQIGSDQDTG